MSNYIRSGENIFVVDDDKEHNNTCTEGEENIPPRYGFTGKFLNGFDYHCLTGDQRVRILKIILEEKENE